MGVYLSKPKTEKESEDGGDVDTLRYGLTSMQGWRRNMEDAHIATSNVLKDSPVSIYGVFDGHGGAVVAAWVSQHFNDEFEKNVRVMRGKLTSGEINRDTIVKCSMEEAISGHNVDIATPDTVVDDGCVTSDNGISICASGMEIDDINVIAEDPEVPIEAWDMEFETVLICEALQKTFLSLDTRMRLPESRAELKDLHNSFKAEDEDESDASELQNLLQCYIDGGKNCGVVRVTDDGSGKKCVQIMANRDGNSDYPWAEDEENDETRVENDESRVQEITDEDTMGSQSLQVAAKKDEGEKAVKQTTNKGKMSINEASPEEAEEENLANVQDDAFDSDDDMKGTEPSSDSSGDDQDSTVFSNDFRKKLKPRKRQLLAQDTNLASDATSVLHDNSVKNTAPSEESDIPRMQSYGPENCGATAVVAAVMREPRPLLITANAGDSRVVLSRNGTAVAMSKDHKPNNSREVRRIRAAGGRVLQGRVDGNLNLSRSVGDLAYKSDEGIPQEAQKITSFPDIRLIPIHEDDEFAIIACDGIWDCLGNQEIVDLVRARLLTSTDGIENGEAKNKPRISEISEEVCDKCLSANPVVSEGIGCDNMTMMIVEIGQELRRLGVRKTETDKEDVPRLYKGRLYRLLDENLTDINNKSANEKCQTS